MKKMKRNCFFRFISAVILIIFFGIVVFSLMAFQERDGTIFIISSILLVFQLIICTYLMVNFIEISLEKENGKSFLQPLLVNIFFPTSSIMFVFNDTYFNCKWFNIAGMIVLIIMIIIIYKFTKIDEKHDFSRFRAVNYFMIAFLTGVTFLLEKYFNNQFLKFFISYYYILPMFMLQGLYELLEIKRKKLNS